MAERISSSAYRGSNARSMVPAIGATMGGIAPGRNIDIYGQPTQYGEYSANDWWNMSPQDRQDIQKYGSLEKSREIINLPSSLASMADPYRAERDQLIRDPSAALTKSPFFQFMQERAMNAVSGKNRAAGLRNSGRGQLALQEAGQKSSADFYFPYLAALGKPGQGTNAFWEAYQYLNPRVSGGSSISRLREPRSSLANMAAGNVSATAPPAPALPSGGGSIWENPYGPGMGPTGPLPGYGPSANAGTGYLRNNQSGATYFFNPEQNYLDMGV